MITCKGKFVKKLEKIAQDGKTRLTINTVLAPDQTKIYYLTDYDGLTKACVIGSDYEYIIRVTGSKTGYANLIVDQFPTEL